MALHKAAKSGIVCSESFITIKEDAMDKFVPLGKKSKKAQKEFHAKQRRTWEGISPVTRTVPNGKAYNRKKLKAQERRSSRDFRNETTAAFLLLAIAK